MCPWWWCCLVVQVAAVLRSSLNPDCWGPYDTRLLAATRQCPLCGCMLAHLPGARSLGQVGVTDTEFDCTRVTNN
jgi:hypothetical protein